MAAPNVKPEDRESVDEVHTKSKVEKHGVTQRSRQKMFSSTGVAVLIKETGALLGKEGEYQ